MHLSKVTYKSRQQTFHSDIRATCACSFNAFFNCSTICERVCVCVCSYGRSHVCNFSQGFTAHVRYDAESIKNLEVNKSWNVLILFNHIVWPGMSSSQFLASGIGCSCLSCVRQMVALTNIWLALHYDIIKYVSNSCLYVYELFGTIWDWIWRLIKLWSWRENVVFQEYVFMRDCLFENSAVENI